ncbi:MAG: extracellular solute-binding protein [Solirubrobacteraceae bacterium]|nr:extracellular solute-binding protein [Solirubrobacteraceae bacterium]
MTRTSKRVAAVFAAATLAGGLAACGSDDNKDSGSSESAAPTTASTDVSGSVSMTGIWSGDEQKSFQAVLDAFEAKYPNVKVKYTSAGDNTATVLSTAVEGGNPPDVAAVGQPGLVKEFQEKDALQPLDFAKDTIDAEYPESLAKLGDIDGKLYSFVFKAANKSTVWYNVAAFKNAGVEAPSDWDAFLENAKTIGASGTPAYSIGGADGWTLTDLFENIYLRQAGADKYDQLTNHEIAWTDQSVKDALTAMGQIFSDTKNIVGGTSGALETEFPGSVENVFVDPAKGAQVMEGDFVPGVAASKTKLKPETGYNQFPFPSINGSGPAVVGGGDSIVLFKDSEAGQALVEFLASAEAQTVWAKRGGYSSPNTKVAADVYPDALTKATATAIASADTFRFDMSDLAPAAFGGTAGQGEWKALQDFLQKPDDVDGTAAELEKLAAKAYKN